MKILKINTLILITLFLVCCSTQHKRHIGTWKEEGKGAITFNSDKSLKMVIDNNVIEDGVQIEGHTVKIFYDIDYNKTPIEVKIYRTVEGTDVSNEVFANCLINFKSDDEMEIMGNFEGGKFAQIDPNDKGHYMLLKKEN